VARLEKLDAAAIARAAHHPRLNRSMRLLDLLLFAAEHDDHHLARIGEIVRESAREAPAERADSRGQVIASGSRVVLRDRLASDVGSHVRWQTTGEWRDFDAPWEPGPPAQTEPQRENLRRRFWRLRATGAGAAGWRSSRCRTAGRWGGNRYDLERFPRRKLGNDICEDASEPRLGTEALRPGSTTCSRHQRIGLDTVLQSAHGARGEKLVQLRRNGARAFLLKGVWPDRPSFGLLRDGSGGAAGTAG
jgi:hypothetical protein